MRLLRSAPKPQLLVVLAGILLYGVTLFGVLSAAEAEPPPTFEGENVNPLVGLAGDLMVWILAILPPIALLSTWYLWQVRNEDDRPTRSWILTMLVVASVMVLLAALPSARSALHFLFGREPAYSGPWSTVVVSGSLILAMMVPAYLAARIWIERRRRSRNGGRFPPPGSTD